MIYKRTYNSLKQELKYEFQKEFPDTKPFRKNSFLGLILNAFAGGLHNLYTAMEWGLNQAFAVTADKEYLRLHAHSRIADLTLSQAFGEVCFMGTVGTVINIDDIVTYDNTDYKATESKEIEEIALKISDCRSQYGIITVVCEENHNLVTGSEVTISNTTNFDGTHEIIVDSETVFIIMWDNSISADEATPIIKTAYALVNVQCVEYGEAYNLDYNSPLDTTIAGVTVAGVANEGITGGRDEETTEEYRARFLDYLRNPHSCFNRANVTSVILDEFPKVERVFIKENYPIVNLVQISLLSQFNKQVDSNTIDDIRSRLDELRQINTDINAITIINAVTQTVLIQLSNIRPNNNSLKESIIDTIDEYFLNLEIEENYDIETLKGLIYATIDYETMQSVESFDMIIDSVSSPLPNNTILIPMVEVT